MFIRDLLNQSGPSFSFEFFPPKTEDGFDALYGTVAQLRRLSPTFVSVTYGAGGTTRRKTIDIVAKIKRELRLETMAHLTCVGSTKAEIAQVLDEIRGNGVENVLALRGDPPQGDTTFHQTPGGFAYANELVEFIRSRHDFCIGVAGYPEGHQEAPDLDTDLENLKRKVDAGADFIITQLYFDNRYYFDFVERAAAKGITVPIIPGIMPVLNVSQIKRMTQMCGATIPRKMLADLEALQDQPEAIQQYGIEHSTRQCEELLRQGVPGIHFYTLNRSRSTWQIFENLKRSGIAV
jgi:methylenetetrahydrofolate reductase (NADPH)